MKSTLIVSFLFSFYMGCINAQKRSITDQDYKIWRKLSAAQFSSDGSLVGYEAVPLEGDKTLYIYQNEGSQIDSFARAGGLKFGANGALAVFKISPGFDTLRTLKLKEVKKKKWPQDSLCILDYAMKTMVKLPGLKKYAVSKKGSTLCYLAKEKLSRKGWKPFGKGRSDKKTNILRVYTSYPEVLLELEGVIDFVLAENGIRLAVLRKCLLNKETFYKVEVYDLKSTNPVREFKTAEKFKLSGWSKSADKFAFYQNQDSSLENYELHIYDFNINKSTIVGAPLLKELGFGDSLPSVNQSPLFSLDEKYMVFGVAKRLYEVPDDSLLQEEKASVDIWHYMDHRIQPQQLKGLSREKKKSDWFVYSFENYTLKKLNNDTLQMRFDEAFESKYHLASSNESYAVSSQWSYPWSKDVYRVNIETAKKELIAKDVLYGGSLSPDGSLYTYFDPKSSRHMALRIDTKDTICLTCTMDTIVWQRDNNGAPSLSGPLTRYGFSRATQYYFQSDRDLWCYDFTMDTLICLSSFEGKNRDIKLSLRKKNADSTFVNLTNSYVSGFNKSSKGMHLFSWLEHQNHFDLVEHLSSPHQLVSVEWSEQGTQTLLRRSSIDEYPDVYLSDSKFAKLQRLSNINPQQDSLYWSSVELVSWMSYDSIPLDGLVYLPESYDTSRQYPMLIYYYELNSDNLHRYRSPRPSASIINPVECASNDYIVFVPDIRYRIGYPARSAYDAVMSGTDFMLNEYAIDSTKMGLQGQSWGGYQTAQLITMTKRYAAAMAGAPVSNMFSAYGGIRWGSGINRQFQYEATQSRIGKTIWEAPELYYENSPIFHLPKVETPLLIMHNDADGAVPWYQGIEMYNGMRRLQKPCWMLVYNKDGHNLKKLPNKYDLSIRMNQFFDHYLKSAPMPRWMKRGVPAIEKGINKGYGFDEK